jgi:hypothetical protein
MKLLLKNEELFSYTFEFRRNFIPDLHISFLSISKVLTNMYSWLNE